MNLLTWRKRRCQSKAQRPPLVLAGITRAHVLRKARKWEIKKKKKKEFRANSGWLEHKQNEQLTAAGLQRGRRAGKSQGWTGVQKKWAWPEAPSTPPPGFGWSSLRDDLIYRWSHIFILILIYFHVCHRPTDDSRQLQAHAVVSVKAKFCWWEEFPSAAPFTPHVKNRQILSSHSSS